MIINPTNMSKGKRQEVIDYIKDNGFKRVLDIGGAMNPWAREVVTHYVDIINPKEYHQDPNINDDNLKKSQFIFGDICSMFFWEKFFNENDQFDFIICTQTLEDIRDPFIVMFYMPFLAKEGFVDVPSKYEELCFGIEGNKECREEWGIFCGGPYRGYMHHRWIFSIYEARENIRAIWESNSRYILRVFPKLNFIDNIVLEWATEENKNQMKTLSFWWKDEIPFEIVNNDFLGPNPPTVIDFYKEKLAEGL